MVVLASSHVSAREHVISASRGFEVTAARACCLSEDKSSCSLLSTASQFLRRRSATALDGRIVHQAVLSGAQEQESTCNAVLVVSLQSSSTQKVSFQPFKEIRRDVAQDWAMVETAHSLTSVTTRQGVAQHFVFSGSRELCQRVVLKLSQHNSADCASKVIFQASSLQDTGNFGYYEVMMPSDKPNRIETVACPLNGHLQVEVSKPAQCGVELSLKIDWTASALHVLRRYSRVILPVSMLSLTWPMLFMSSTHHLYWPAVLLSSIMHVSGAAVIQNHFGAFPLADASLYLVAPLAVMAFAFGRVWTLLLSVLRPSALSGSMQYLRRFPVTAVLVLLSTWLMSTDLALLGYGLFVLRMAVTFSRANANLSFCILAMACVTHASRLKEFVWMLETESGVGAFEGITRHLVRSLNPLYSAAAGGFDLSAAIHLLREIPIMALVCSTWCIVDVIVGLTSQLTERQRDSPPKTTNHRSLCMSVSTSRASVFNSMLVLAGSVAAGAALVVYSGVGGYWTLESAALLLIVSDAIAQAVY